MGLINSTNNNEMSTTNSTNSNKNVIPEGYWEASYGMLVPSSIKGVPSPDQCNTNESSGCSTKMLSYRPTLTRDEYLEKYANSVDGVYYYKC